jgi:hypothetical protein
MPDTPRHISMWLPTLACCTCFVAGLEPHRVEQCDTAAHFGPLPLHVNGSCRCACMRWGRSQMELCWGIIIFNVIVKGEQRRRQRWCGDMSRSLHHNSNTSMEASWPSLSHTPPCTNPCHSTPTYHSATYVPPPCGSCNAPTVHAWAQQPICMWHASL